MKQTVQQTIGDAYPIVFKAQKIRTEVNGFKDNERERKIY
jgi:hypothetical protein